MRRMFSVDAKRRLQLPKRRATLFESDGVFSKFSVICHDLYIGIMDGKDPIN
ncbi:MAG: hypothetical protein Q4D38_07775 [Planctomycetia bacterium]|nr:hypothetical protein [Planctomycetia bacterium]